MKFCMTWWPLSAGAGLALTAALLMFGEMAQAQTTAPAASTASAPEAQRTVKSPAKDAPCLECHDDLTDDPVLHGGLEKGCSACHGNIDGTKRPHKRTGSLPFGLTAVAPELCMNCHEKKDFKKKSTHGALDKGCGECHEAHASKHRKLLKKTVPELCVGCHKDRTYFGKGLHSAVSSGRCGSCHLAHASDNTGLLKKQPAETCLDCHDEIKEAPHMLAGFARKGHPVGDEEHAQQVADPLRPGKPFYCASCHQPHKSEFPNLLRFDLKEGMGVCQKCHQK